MRATADVTDDDVPGVESPGSPLTGELDKASDADDVWSVYLTEGQTLTARIVGDPGTDFDIYLFGPGTSSVYTLDGPLDEASTGSYPDALVFPVRVSGTYYLDAYTYEGSGSYTLEYSTSATQPGVGGPDDDVPGVALPSSAVVGTLDVTTDYDDVFAVPLRAGQTLTARITGGDGTDFDLYLYGPDTTSVVDSTEWLACAAGGSYPDSLSFAARTAATYYLDAWAYAGAGSYTLQYSVKSRPFVGTPVAPARVSKSKRFAVYGTLGPAHPAGTRPVRIYRWRQTSSGAWKSHGYVTAVAKDRDGATRYYRRMRLPHRGRWRLRAFAGEDASHTAAWSSGYDYVTVK